MRPRPRSFARWKLVAPADRATPSRKPGDTIQSLPPAKPDACALNLCEPVAASPETRSLPVKPESHRLRDCALACLPLCWMSVRWSKMASMKGSNRALPARGMSAPISPFNWLASAARPSEVRLPRFWIDVGRLLPAAMAASMPPTTRAWFGVAFAGSSGDSLARLICR